MRRDDSPSYLARSATVLGGVVFYQGRLEEAEAILQDALARQRALYGEKDRVTISTAQILGSVLRDLGRLDEAEEIQRRQLDLVQARQGKAHYLTATAKYLLVLVLDRRAEYEEAERLAREVVAENTRALGPEHGSTGERTLALGSILLDRGKAAEAETHLRRGLAIVRRAFDDYPEAGDALNRLAYLLLRRRDAGARPAYEKALEFRRSRPPGAPIFVTDGVHFLAWSMHHMGDRAGAEALYRRALDLYRSSLPSHHPYRAATATGLGEVLLDLGRPAQAEPYLREGLTAWEAWAMAMPQELAHARALLERCRAALPGA